MAAHALDLGNGRYAVLRTEIQDDGKGFELFQDVVGETRTDALLKMKLDTDPAIYLTPNVNSVETGYITDDGALGVAGYTKD